MTYFLSPIGGVAATSPEGGSVFLVIASVSVAIPWNKVRNICRTLFQGDCRGTSCLAMTTSRAMVRWDISLTLNMTYFSLYVILNAVKNPTEELTGHLLFTLVVGYFANAQYDVREL